jgi:hypothetical protein
MRFVLCRVGRSQMLGLVKRSAVGSSLRSTLLRPSVVAAKPLPATQALGGVRQWHTMYPVYKRTNSLKAGTCGLAIMQE